MWLRILISWPGLYCQTVDFLLFDCTRSGGFFYVRSEEGVVVDFFIAADGTEENPHQILIMDNIGESFWSDGVTAKDVVAALSSVDEGDHVLVRINCRGGDTQDGTAIYNALADRSGRVVCRVEGYSCSMATVSMLGADTVEAYETAMFMTHKAATGVWGNADDMRHAADLLDKVDGALALAYSRKLGCSAEEAQALLTPDRDKWFSAAEALELKLIDAVVVPQKFNLLLDKSASALLGNEGAALVAADQLPKDWQMFLGAIPDVVALRVDAGRQLELVRADSGASSAPAPPVVASDSGLIGASASGATGPELVDASASGTAGPELVDADAIIRAERKRVDDINAMAAKNGLDLSGDFVRSLISSGVEALVAGRQILAVKAEVSSQSDAPSSCPASPVDSLAGDGWDSAYSKK